LPTDARFIADAGGYIGDSAARFLQWLTPIADADPRGLADMIFNAGCLFFKKKKMTFSVNMNSVGKKP
jgi:hypothetical protein